MKCPNCKDKDLEAADIEGYPVEVDHCSTCDGMWLDRGELEQLLEAPGGALRFPRGAAPTRRMCPTCSRAMYTFYYPRTFVAVDMCKLCHGLWLDRREFEEIDTVRRFAKESGVVAREKPKKPSGIKGLLLEFIEVNIAAHKFWK
jgi:Zn-finger nucleic acid-binding protein